jgi:CheY-like chemotaxis protein/glycine cleavage system H lipoate-binding protein
MQEEIKILAVDDEQVVLDGICKHLRGEGYSPSCALSVHEALTALGQGEFDIILTDLKMPGIDGLDFMRDIKKRHPSIVLIMITGYATITTALQAKELGAFDYIAKPFAKAELLEVVKRAVEFVRSSKTAPDPRSGAEKMRDGRFQSLGEKSWLMMEGDLVVIGIERELLHEVGEIQTIVLPDSGDVLRQGTECVKILSSDMRNFNVVSPLSGTVREVNAEVLDDPQLLSNDPYGSGWLIRLEPSNFEKEVELLGL